MSRLTPGDRAWHTLRDEDVTITYVSRNGEQVMYYSESTNGEEFATHVSVLGYSKGGASGGELRELREANERLEAKLSDAYANNRKLLRELSDQDDKIKALEGELDKKRTTYAELYAENVELADKLNAIQELL